jgi:hypothetical protein
MKKYEKFILPGLVIAAAILLYTFYFAPTDELGSFTDFDPNSHASVDIIVEFVKEKGVVRDQRQGGSIFYVKDRSGRETQVIGPLMLPDGMEVADRIKLTGHLSGSGFHAHGVSLN